LKENTKTWELYKEFNQIDISNNIVKERHRHRYEVNPKFHEILSKN
jgi:CTP synthase (UTP-ammonia lyase)